MENVLPNIKKSTFILVPVVLAMMAIPIYLTPYIPHYKPIFIMSIIIAMLFNYYRINRINLWVVAILVLFLTTSLFSGRAFEDQEYFIAIFFRLLFLLFIAAFVTKDRIDAVLLTIVYVALFFCITGLLAHVLVILAPSLIIIKQITGYGLNAAGAATPLDINVVTLLGLPLSYYIEFAFMPRLLSFATEPASFAFFLIFPGFLTYYFYDNKRVGVAHLIIIWSCIFLTISINAYLSLLITSLIYYAYKAKFMKVTIIIFLMTLCLIVVAGNADFSKIATYEGGYNHGLDNIGFGRAADIAYKIAEVKIFFKRLADCWFLGTSMQDMEIKLLTSSILQWTLLFGIFNSLLLYGLIIFYILKGLALSKFFNNPLINSVTLSLIVLTIMNMNTYHLISNMYILNLGMLIVLLSSSSGLNNTAKVFVKS